MDLNKWDRKSKHYIELKKEIWRLSKLYTRLANGYGDPKVTVKATIPSEHIRLNEVFFLRYYINQLKKHERKLKNELITDIKQGFIGYIKYKLLLVTKWIRKALKRR